MAKLLLVSFCVLAVSALAVENPEKYEAASDCDEPPMGSSSPSDSMPHDFPSSIPTSAAGLDNTMNAYTSEMEMLPKVPTNFASMPGSATPPQHLSIESRIPYEIPEDKPALRRPCNLDEILDLLRDVKHDFTSEDKHDSEIHAAVSVGVSPLTTAKSNADQAKSRVQELEEAKAANHTLAVVIETIALKNQMSRGLLEEKALLLREEGMLKTPILKSIGRTNLNLQAAIDAKQAALKDLSMQPGMNKDQLNTILSTYDELILSLKKQVASLHKEASDVLTPVQLSLNQTENSVQRVDAEIADLRQQQSDLEPIARKYSEDALSAARVTLEAVRAHLDAQVQTHKLDLGAFDTRSSDRSNVLELVDRLIMLVSDIQEPVDPSAQFVESRVAEDLSGSVARRPDAL